MELTRRCIDEDSGPALRSTWKKIYNFNLCHACKHSSFIGFWQAVNHGASQARGLGVESSTHCRRPLELANVLAK